MTVPVTAPPPTAAPPTVPPPTAAPPTAAPQTVPPPTVPPATVRPAADRSATVWPQRDGSPVSCVEKLKVLRENETELRSVLGDAFDDAVLMGVDPAAMRELLLEMVRALPGPGASTGPG